jgi:hypothetical protein
LTVAAEALARLLAWLETELRDEDLLHVIPPDDPLRAWWQPTPGDRRLQVLFELIDGNDDRLTPLALVQAVRERFLHATPPVALPAAIDHALGHYLSGIACRARTRGQAGAHDVFVSYSIATCSA